MVLWLTETDVCAALPVADVIHLMGPALAAFSAGRVEQPVRTFLPAGAERSFFALMPAFDAEHAVMGAKLVTVFPGNAARGLPTHLAAIALFDPRTGELLAVMDGRYITEIRTAAVSAVSVRHLARGDASTLAILGSGVQARSHLAALREVRAFGDVRAWSPNAGRLAAFVSESGEPVRAAKSAEEAVRGADVVVLATSSIVPVIEDAWVGAGTHVIAVGACRPDHRETPPALVARARLVVDSRAAALREAGDLVMAIEEGFCAADHIHAELGEVVSGTWPGRQSAGEVTLFKSLGLAIEDIAAAALAYRRAQASGRGVSLAL